ncbi:MAG TPA: YeeE/YedE family protein [Rubrobacteraceae bacterium]|nr:YeeE/YedE family protein [Rubrobacteraceae bacterium]
MRTLSAMFCGLVFGLGLAISGMMNPAKVIGFLDVAGDWDPTLAFVMGGALLVAVPAFRFIPKRPRPVLEDDFSLPTKKTLDAPLLGGSALFGIGWGLVGFCPGPAVAALGTGLPVVLAFVAAMLSGMALYSWLSGKAG